jgi:hypothetical protein
MIFRYNPRHPDGKCWIPDEAQENEAPELERREQVREEHTCDFFARVFAGDFFFSGGYIDDANPSESDQQSARAMV